MDYTDNIKQLQILYRRKGLEKYFSKDNQYLTKAFTDINGFWTNNFNQIESIKYLMIAEAPLWGDIKKYIYNPETKNSQFFHCNDLGIILNKNILDKKEFLKHCNEIGLLVIDISPFALNPKFTQINYRQLGKDDYRQLVNSTLSTYFEKKIDLIENKRSVDIKVFFRYSRVKETFQDLIAQVLINKKVISDNSVIGDISKQGGNIDREKLRKIIKTT